ncbi:sulfite exporter TauE/SafE family protein [Pseudorhodoferax sp.]|uniref:sulfite exporter TauE/SafE family protein n=1 Tax=Pseudorhodoferax sp. TaxID=1993553 RepID=UPI002DD62C28|nr:sulfite exporter TauE/SafE family protein [Pseudorhodoferax sp.]
MFGFDLPTLAWIWLASLAAFVVRGMTGFGSSMVGIGALSVVLPPAQVVPAFLALELLTTAHLLPSVWRRIVWPSLRWVMLGCAMATPAGVLLLAHVPADVMRLAVSGTLLALALPMLAGHLQPRADAPAPGRASALAVGATSGLLNGAAGIGGPPAIVFYFAHGALATGRATLIAYFLFTDIVALAWAGGSGLLARTGWSLVLVALPAALIGITAGQRLYLRLAEATLRRLVWALLAVLGALGCLAAALRMAAGTAWAALC